MGEKQKQEWAEKCERIAALARDLGLVVRFYSPAIFVVCSPDDGGGEACTETEDPGGTGSGRNSSDGGEGRTVGTGSGEGTLL